MTKEDWLKAVLSRYEAKLMELMGDDFYLFMEQTIIEVEGGVKYDSE